MHRAKSRGKVCYEIFDKSMHTEITSRLQLESDLWQAVETQAFDIYYQPIVSLRTGQITGCEALLRWNHPARGFISPATFIPVAEDIGAIMPIGEWVLKTACRQNKIWCEAGYPQLQMAINVSARQFQHQDIPQLIKNALRETDTIPYALKVEITESIAMIDIDSTIATLNTLTNLRE